MKSNHEVLLENIIAALRSSPEFNQALPLLRGVRSPQDATQKLMPYVQRAVSAELEQKPEVFQNLIRSASLRGMKPGQREEMPELPPAQPPQAKPSIPATRPSGTAQTEPAGPGVQRSSVPSQKHMGAVELLRQDPENFPADMINGISAGNRHYIKAFWQKTLDAFNGRNDAKIPLLISAIAQLADNGLIKQELFQALKNLAKSKGLL